MILDSGDVDDLRRAVSENLPIRLSEIEDLSLGAATELAVAFVGWREAGTQAAMRLVSTLSKRSRTFDRTIDALDGISSVVPGDYDAPLLDIQPVAPSLDAVEWLLFSQRLRRSLEANGGFEPRKAMALSKVMSELVDNVIEHSGVAGTTPSRAVVGYAIESGRMNLAIGDVGRGVLESLRENPEWRERLPNARAAIEAAVLEHASRRTLTGLGGLGLRSVQQTLVDLNGSLRFRSGDAALTLEGPGQAREIRRSHSPQMPGFQVAISCSTSGNY